MTEQEHAERIKSAVEILNKAVIAARNDKLRVDVTINRGPSVFGIHDDPDEPRDLIAVRVFRRL